MIWMVWLYILTLISDVYAKVTLLAFWILTGINFCHIFWLISPFFFYREQVKLKSYISTVVLE